MQANNRVYTLENEFVRIQVNALGAEWSSFFDLTQKMELLWQADPSVWARHAPVLFPIVGQVKGGIYQYEGKSYHLSQHGFARDRVFDLQTHTNDALVFSLESNEETKAVYPFDFRLEISYRLQGKMVEIAYAVNNTGSKPMLFSIGAHPGFRCPFVDGTNFESYQIRFEQDEQVRRYRVVNGLIADQSSAFEIKNASLPLRYEDFDADALILEGLKSNAVVLEHVDTAKGIRFEFAGFPLLAFWTKPGAKAPFLCIEPWYGLSDVASSTQQFHEKRFIQALASLQSFQCSYRVGFQSA